MFLDPAVEDLAREYLEVAAECALYVERLSSRRSEGELFCAIEFGRDTYYDN